MKPLPAGLRRRRRGRARRGAHQITRSRWRLAVCNDRCWERACGRFHGARSLCRCVPRGRLESLWSDARRESAQCIVRNLDGRPFGQDLSRDFAVPLRGTPPTRRQHHIPLSFRDLAAEPQCRPSARELLVLPLGVAPVPLRIGHGVSEVICQYSSKTSTLPLVSLEPCCVDCPGQRERETRTPSLANNRQLEADG